MSAPSVATAARVEARLEGDCLQVALGGRWKITQARPTWDGVVADAAQPPARVRLAGADDLEGWDSSLVLFVDEAQRWCRGHDAFCDVSGLPEAVRQLVGQMTGADDKKVSTPPAPKKTFLAALGTRAQGWWREANEITAFAGECVLGALFLVRHPRKFRWRDCLGEMQQCGAMALPIVGLISFLVGVTLAYTGAQVLRQVGGDIWIADLIGLAMVRESAAVMTAVVLAGRTGAAFAATLGNMKAGEEIDAFVTLGIKPVNFLVLPRVVALGLMTPLLALYANALGIIGGMVVARSVLGVQPAAYWVEMLQHVNLTDIATGMIKATVFGLIVGLSGCLRGLQAERSAEGVGRAATSAVVTALLLLVVADAVFAVIFHILGW
jgi:phospholipid/cholesterol/gamma-HCH transport system permease protein